MKILHLALSNYYVDNYQYQENILTRQNKIDGHEVLIVASIEGFDSRYRRIKLDAGEYVNEDGITVIRVRYRKYFDKKYLIKIRTFRDVYKIMEEFAPDIIFFHGIAGWEILTIAKYKRKHPKVRFYADSHADFNNSAKNFFSKLLLYKLFYRMCYKIAEKWIDKLFYITLETKFFAKKMFSAQESKLFYLPLGGNPIVSDIYYIRERNKIRNSLNIHNDDLLFITTGKFGPHKRLIELLTAFDKFRNNDRIKLVILGQFYSDIEDTALAIINNNNSLIYLGWKSSTEVDEFLCAADIYIQLAGQTVSMQNALCHRCAVALFPYPSHLHLLGDAAFYIKDKLDIENLVTDLLLDVTTLDKKKSLCWKIARDKLDYKQIVKEYT